MGGILDCFAVDSRVITEALKTAASVAGMKVMGISFPTKKNKTRACKYPEYSKKYVNQILIIPIDDDNMYLITVYLVGPFEFF